MDLDTLYSKYDKDESFKHLRLPGIQLVRGEGALFPGGVMFVGEAPGMHENTTGRPFVGVAGSVLNRMLDHIGCPRHLVYLTNLLKYRPMNPENRDPTPYEVGQSVPYLTQEINLVNPKIIVPLGRHATRVFFPGVSVRNVRGKVNKRNGRLVIPTYHPAYIAYNSDKEEVLKAQFETIRDVILKGA